ncbi:MAG: hypothetical protein MJ025_04795 [Victivallaceae bacterium]|nr:hypothetical protein [Victivallaceae bacterium]
MNRLRHVVQLAVMAALLAASVVYADSERKITFVEDNAQHVMTTKIFVLKHVKASDILPFVNRACLRYDKSSTADSINDAAQNRQLLVVSTGVNMMPYVIDMIEMLDHDCKTENQYGTGVSGDGMKFAFYRPKFRSSLDMENIVFKGGIASSFPEGHYTVDRKTGTFYFQDTPATIVDILSKLEFLDKPTPQARVELKIYEVRDSQLHDVGIDYLAWKNGPGLNIFSAGFQAFSMEIAEKMLEQLFEHGFDFASMTYGFGGFYTAPAFDFSFIRLLQQNSQARINSSASLLVTNTPDRTFSVYMSPEYQRLTKDEKHRSEVLVGGDATLGVMLYDVTIAGHSDGIINFSYLLDGSSVVERNNMGEEISNGVKIGSTASMKFGIERILCTWKRDEIVEQSVGVPILCELPILKYIFGTTTQQTETVHYFITAKVVPVTINDTIPSGALAEFAVLTGNK